MVYCFTLYFWIKYEYIVSLSCFDEMTPRGAFFQHWFQLLAVTSITDLTLQPTDLVLLLIYLPTV